MHHEKMSEEELLDLYNNMPFDDNRKNLIVFIRNNVLWQDIVALRPLMKTLAINICRTQEKFGLREAIYAVENELYKQERGIK